MSGAYNYPGVTVEWCPDPFQLTRRPTGDVTEPEVWESGSEGDESTPSVLSAARSEQGFRPG